MCFLLLLQEKRTAKQLKTENGPKPAPSAAGSSTATADVDMKDADAAAAGTSSSAAAGAVVAGAQTGVWVLSACVIASRSTASHWAWLFQAVCQ